MIEVPHRRHRRGNSFRVHIEIAASKEPLEFQAGDLKILSAIAALTAPAVSQAQRYESVARGDE